MRISTWQRNVGDGVRHSITTIKHSSSEGVSRQLITMCKEYLGINDLVEAVNRGDRLGLLHDPTAPAGNLNNAIHPLFHDSCFLEQSLHLKQMLQLASLFLQYDSLLEFFIPLSYGRTHVDDATGKKYLTNPVASKSGAELKKCIAGVRQALHCLEHCVVFRWSKPKADSLRLWARTTLYPARRSEHTAECSTSFAYKNCVLIEMNEALLRFYKDEKSGYRESSRCAQFRHDWQTAVSIVHEIVHAYGAMHRGNLSEPHIRCDHPDKAEWGYAWENFMFGGIINPQDRLQAGTHIQLRKIWADPEQEKKGDGKEYSAISMSWLAQWFQRKTWDKIKTEGPLAIAPPTIHVKFFLSCEHRRWVVMTDVPETQRDIQELQDKYAQLCANNLTNGRQNTNREIDVSRVIWMLVDSKRLQKSNVPIPVRVPPKIIFSAGTGPPPKRLSVATARYSASNNGSVGSTTVTVTSSVKSTPSCSTRSKRARDDGAVDAKPPRKVVKRITSR